jgi:uncharacterized protein (UPF0335 family)
MLLQISQQVGPDVANFLISQIGLLPIIIFIVKLFMDNKEAKNEIKILNKKVEKLEEEITNLKTDIKEGIHEIQKTLLKMELELKHLKEQKTYKQSPKE